MEKKDLMIFMKEHFIIDLIDMLDHYGKNGGENYLELLKYLGLTDQAIEEIENNLLLMSKKAEEINAIDAKECIDGIIEKIKEEKK